jgi:Kyakuja-Dileera-Zisupton transposase
MRDPLIFTPCVVQLSEGDLKEWEAKVDIIWDKQPSKIGSKCKAVEAVESDAGPPDADDKCEPGMPIPNSCADSCGELFIAADSDCIKASTIYFSDTGMMVLLCHHDVVLFWTNMWTTSKKQFFALALLTALMAELPPDWTLQFLYDIACQMHRSLIKWEFLPEFLPHILFGISISHAYGHQWVCQLWYHP